MSLLGALNLKSDFLVCKLLSRLLEISASWNEIVLRPVSLLTFGMTTSVSGIEIEKKSPKAVEVLKKGCQAFGTVVAKSLGLKEAFHYPITSMPLSVASPDRVLRQ